MDSIYIKIKDKETYQHLMWFLKKFGKNELEIMEAKGLHVSTKIPALLVLIGGLILRFVVVDAGQTSRWLYKFLE